MSRNSASSVQYRPASRVVRAVIYARLMRISGSRARTSMSNWMARFWTPKHDKTCVERSVSNGMMPAWADS